jgi:hypothetical protein
MNSLVAFIAHKKQKATIDETNNLDINLDNSSCCSLMEPTEDS